MSPSSSPAVVLVDDEKAYADLLTRALREILDVPIHCFARPVDALEALPQIPVALLVSDFFMPQLNGYQFLTRALEVVPGTPCILITGHNHAFHDRRLAELPELKAILAKPFPPRVLVEAVRQHCPALAGAGGGQPAAGERA